MTDIDTPRATPHALTHERKPWLSLGLLVATALCAALAWLVNAPATSCNVPLAPALATESRCTQLTSAAGVRAQDLLRRAHVRWERAGFDASSAIAALRDAEEAVACLAMLPSSEAFDEARAFAAQVRAQVVRDYQTLQLRLRIARDRGDAVSAREAATALRMLIGDDDQPYSRWLLAIEHAVVTGTDAP